MMHLPYGSLPAPMEGSDRFSLSEQSHSTVSFVTPGNKPAVQLCVEPRVPSGSTPVLMHRSVRRGSQAAQLPNCGVAFELSLNAFDLSSDAFEPSKVPLNATQKKVCL